MSPKFRPIAENFLRIVEALVDRKKKLEVTPKNEEYFALEKDIASLRAHGMDSLEKGIKVVCEDLLDEREKKAKAARR